MTEFSARLREMRKKSGLKVPEVLSLLKEKGVSISDKTLYNWETGIRTPDADEFIKLCRVYKVKSFKEFEETEIKKAPEPEGTEEREQGIDAVEDKLRSLLLDLGLMPDGDLTAEQLEFLAHIVALIQAFFKK